jgi:predicted nucleic acid-binding protein
MPGSSAGIFIDSNVILYVVSADPVKADRAEAILRDGGTISVQVLNELANVLRRKPRLSWAAVNDILLMVRALLVVSPMTVEIHETGLILAERHRLSVYDAMIVSAALHADCHTLWSEDMQDGLVIESRLRIANPFR